MKTTLHGRTRHPYRLMIAITIVSVLLVACSSPTVGERPVDQSQVGTLGPLPKQVPALPFPDNPDPTQCGIPEVWGSDGPAWISGYHHGELVQPVV